MRTFTVHGSHGEVTVDSETGLVTACNAEDYGENNNYSDIDRFDVAGHCLRFGDEMLEKGGVGILDIGYWWRSGQYEPPVWEHRYVLNCAEEGVLDKGEEMLHADVIRRGLNGVFQALQVDAGQPPGIDEEDRIVQAFLSLDIRNQFVWGVLQDDPGMYRELTRLFPRQEPYLRGVEGAFDRFLFYLASLTTRAFSEDVRPLQALLKHRLPFIWSIPRTEENGFEAKDKETIVWRSLQYAAQVIAYRKSHKERDGQAGCVPTLSDNMQLCWRGRKWNLFTGEQQ